ncbi:MULTISPECIES: hypothetical protein [unclassified Bradyrhizobium]|uniref:hypothetical protein n=1 Tax=unclassified Bradyrhizobium TaxID=2631580 RepID=UPI002FEF91CF
MPDIDSNKKPDASQPGPPERQNMVEELADSSDAGTLPPARLEAVFLVGGKLAKGETKSRTAGFLPAIAGSVIFADFRPVSRSVN